MQRIVKQTKNMFDFRGFPSADCVQWHRALRQKTTKSLNLAEKIDGRRLKFANTRQRRALVEVREADHRVGTSTLLCDPCPAAA
jgi:hypothetical protein